MMTFVVYECGVADWQLWFILCFKKLEYRGSTRHLCWGKKDRICQDSLCLGPGVVRLDQVWHGQWFCCPLGKYELILRSICKDRDMKQRKRKFHFCLFFIWIFSKAPTRRRKVKYGREKKEKIDYLVLLGHTKIKYWQKLLFKPTNKSQTC